MEVSLHSFHLSIPPLCVCLPAEFRITGFSFRWALKKVYPKVASIIFSKLLPVSESNYFITNCSKQWFNHFNFITINAIAAISALQYLKKSAIVFKNGAR